MISDGLAITMIGVGIIGFGTLVLEEMYRQQYSAELKQLTEINERSSRENDMFTQLELNKLLQQLESMEGGTQIARFRLKLKMSREFSKWYIERKRS